MNARMRRLASDWEQIKKDFTGHKNIIVTPVGNEPPEKYHVTYFVNGIYLLADGRIETLGRHEVEITLHADYPRYKPICKILTSIWHPNFRDGQICIGDIWGAGESLTDIIINIGDMIQYKSWNSYSPLSADAAQWAMENKHLFPVGNVNLYIADYASAKDTVEIDLFDEQDEVIQEETEATGEVLAQAASVPAEETETLVTEGESVVTESVPIQPEKTDDNDFEITAEELDGIEFIPTAQRMQTVSHSGMVKGGKINFKTILTKGLLWAMIGGLLGFGISEITEDNLTSAVTAASLSGNSALVEYYEIQAEYDNLFEKIDDEFKDWCDDEGMNPEAENSMSKWLQSGISDEMENTVEAFLAVGEEKDEALYDAYVNEYNSDEDLLSESINVVSRVQTALWSAVIALLIGLFLGLGEGIFYGSKEKAFKYALIGAGISIVIGFISGYLAQWMYSEMLDDDASDFAAALVRGLGWAVMGLGVGAAVGLIKPEKKRILFCSLGGLGGGFFGGFLFNYVCDIIPNDVVARCVAIVVMGILIGLGVGLLEQYAKQAWLKVIRGEFEGKEYLVFAGTTSIGNNGKNTIVLFKDKLVGPHHCDIKLEGSKYVLVDCGTPMGTVVNGNRTARHVLRQGDAIAIGNSVLVFNTK